MKTRMIIKKGNPEGSDRITTKLTIWFAVLIFIVLHATIVYSQPGTTITVSGAGTADCNGDYEMMAYVEGRSAYLKDFPNGDILIYFNEGKWIIAKFDTSYTPPWPLLNTYYNNDAQTNNPPGSNWYCVAPDGLEPPPALSGDGVEPGTDVSDKTIYLPRRMILYPAYPNPFNPTTHITFGLPQRGDVSMHIYDLQGSLVRILTETSYEAGTHTLIWDGTDKHGGSVATGIYLCRLHALGFQKTIRMLYLK